MLHIPSQFHAGGPISQVPASWFKAVADFINNLVAGYGLKLNKTANGPSVIEIDPNVIMPVSGETGTPEDETDTAPDDYTDPTEADVGHLVIPKWTWTAGGDNGLKLDVYCRVFKDEGWHYLSRARLTFSKSGLLVKAEGIEGTKEIEA